jgi:hydrogenase maturation protease
VDKPSALILGYGNPARQDDGLGPAAAESIERLALGGVTTSAAYQLMIEDASAAAECDLVIFIDAAKSGPVPFSIDRVAPARSVSPFVSHAVAPEFILGLCRDLYGRAPNGLLIGIRGYRFGYGERLTNRAQANLEQAVAYVANVVR